MGYSVAIHIHNSRYVPSLGQLNMGYYTRFRHILRLKGTLSLETGLGKPVAMLLQRFSEFSCFTTNLYLSWYPKGTWDKVLYSSVIPVTIDRFHSLSFSFSYQSKFSIKPLF